MNVAHTTRNSPEPSSFTLDDIPRFGEDVVRWLASIRYRPSTIVAVERGGLLLAEVVANGAGGSLRTMRVQRRGGRLKKALGPLLRRAPTRLRDALRRAEHSSGVHRLLGRGAGSVGSTWSAGPTERVLVVDDAVDSGETMGLVLGALREAGATQTKVAVVTVTHESSRHLVDFAWMSGLTRFPWSVDSPEWAAFRARYDAAKRCHG